MFVRNFFTKAVADYTGSYAYFSGSVLGVEARFRASFEWNNFFYLKIKDGLMTKPFIRVKYFPTKIGLFLMEVEVYSYDSGLYEALTFTDKDRAFLRHIASTCSAALSRAAMEWEWRNSVDYIPF